ncbi:dolichol-phosphate mannosyltransferase [Candidatus Electrothrix marina]|uniref:Dolichol-phosphate mannosyltransferase n=1 Tax=Candidatus Electrothrix marina TaxID=1859130 RepID=A0A444JFN6_9BACT|nr:dolichol-phosphate mannosyltransferase [Candidatus Electrothrix marina]
MKLSLIIPAHNEEGCIEETARLHHSALTGENIDHEILVVNDNSLDNTENILKCLEKEIEEIRYVNNSPPNGFGFAVRKGLNNYSGDAVAIVMADGSDSPQDVVRFYKKLLSGYDCVFGSRFIKGGATYDYPKVKLLVNRMANFFIKTLFTFRYNDTTNAFKMYTRETLDGLRPFLSHHFNLTVELPLKAITRGYNYTVLPNTWKNRTTGEAKLKLKEMGSRYLFIVLYCLIEKWLSVGDYRKKLKS